tara:strand:+ start:100 stop:411 length:312 start_codon:yes stop_codon:yes gene_type:complete
MALEESIEYDKIEVVGMYKLVQVRKATVIKKDGAELTRSFERFVLDPGTLDSGDNLVDNPLTKEPDGTTDIADEVKAVCTAVWTGTVKVAWKEKLIADKSSTP